VTDATEPAAAPAIEPASEPANEHGPGIAAGARALHERDPSAVAFGIELLDASPSGASVRMPVRREHCNGFEILHGGMTFLLADSAMAFASNASGEVALASSAEIDWLAPVHIGTVLTATATRRWMGGRSALWDVTITDGDGNTVAVMRGRTRTVSR
jgi:acyl-CoA thioesterase